MKKTNSDIVEEPVEETRSTNISISLPRTLIAEVEDYAKRHKLKKSQVIAMALKGFTESQNEIFKRLGRIEEIQHEIMETVSSPTKTEQEKPKSPEGIEATEKLTTLISDCENMLTFEIEGDDWEEEGFKFLVKQRELLGDDYWTDDRLDLIMPHLVRGYAGYWIKPNRDKWLEEIADAMQLEKQRPVLIEKFNELYDQQRAQDESEEEW